MFAYMHIQDLKQSSFLQALRFPLETTAVLRIMFSVSLEYQYRVNMWIEFQITLMSRMQTFLGRVLF